MFQKSKVLFALGAALIIAGTGCAKKHKPDVDANAANAMKVVADKDLTFDAEGSDSEKIDGLKSIHFGYDEATLNSESRDILVGNTSWLKRHPNASLEIQGHCDRHGSTEYNLALGERRAEVVKKYMINLGADAQRLKTISYGKERLLDQAETEAADMKNRRANFKPMESLKTSPITKR